MMNDSILDDLKSHRGDSPRYRNLIRELPIVKYQSLQIQSENKCLVCMEDFCRQDDVRILKCFHHFH